MSYETMHRTYEILDQVYKKRQEIIASDCYGCVHDSPSQRDHPCLELTRPELRDLSRRALIELQLKLDDEVHARVLDRIEEKNPDVFFAYDEVDRVDGA
jgi:hypothetical protein